MDRDDRYGKEPALFRVGSMRPTRRVVNVHGFAHPGLLAEHTITLNTPIGSLTVARRQIKSRAYIKRPTAGGHNRRSYSQLHEVTVAGVDLACIPPKPARGTASHVSLFDVAREGQGIGHE